MNLSKRMETVVGFVSPQSCSVADIGCDHAYVSIALIERKLAKKVIAMDVRKGPLKIAAKNVKNAGLHNVIDLRLGDGLDKLECNEADTIIIAGMGGLLITGILERGFHVLKGSKHCKAPTLILQPQSEIRKVREFLLAHGYSIVREEMIKDEGKYYTVLKAEATRSSHNDSMSFDKEAVYGDEDYLYGRYNLLHQNEVLKQYLMDERELLNKIYSGLLCVKEHLEKEGNEMPERAGTRLEEVKKNITCNENGLGWYKEV